jgi:hypothetical protein
VDPVISYQLQRFRFKGIVSRDFELCFLVPLDSSDIATPSGAGSFFLRRFRVEFLIFRALALVVFAGQGTTKDWVKIGLQRNNKYSFDRARPGLTLKC